MNRKEIGSALKAERELRKLTLYAVRELCGLNILTVMAIESGSNYTLVKLEKYCLLLNFSINIKNNMLDIQRVA